MAEKKQDLTEQELSKVVGGAGEADIAIRWCPDCRNLVVYRHNGSGKYVCDYCRAEHTLEELQKFADEQAKK